MVYLVLLIPFARDYIVYMACFAVLLLWFCWFILLFFVVAFLFFFFVLFFTRFAELHYIVCLYGFFSMF